MVKITLVRHGKTEWNLEKRIQGRLESDLLPESLTAAERRGEEFRNRFFCRSYASTSRRALKTRELIHRGMGTRPPEFADPRLLEMNMGDMQGLRADEAKARFPEAFDNWFYHPDRYVPVGGETYDEIFGRVGAFLTDEIEPMAGAGSDCGGGGSCEVLIVSHGITIMVFEVLMQRLPRSVIRDMRPIGNLEYVEYVFDGAGYTKRAIAQNTPV